MRRRSGVDTPTGDGLQHVGVVTQGTANLLHGGVEGRLPVNEDVFAPHLPERLIVRDDSTLPICKQEEELQGLWIELDDRTAATKGKGGAIEIKAAYTPSAVLRALSRDVQKISRCCSGSQGGVAPV